MENSSADNQTEEIICFTLESTTAKRFKGF